MEVVRFLAGRLVRRGWRATILLALLAGLAGGVAMAAFAAGRRTATSFDRFLRYADPPELIITFCPPDLVDLDETSLARCFNYDAVDEIAMLNTLPEVETAARASFRGLTAARADEPGTRWLANSTLLWDEDIPSLEGQPILVAGRFFSPSSVEEVVINERFREQSGVSIGDDLMVTFWGPDEIGKVPDAGDALTGPTARVRVVGVVRSLLDLAASTRINTRVIEEAELIGGPALAAATSSAGGYGGVVVRARRDDGEAVSAAAERAFPDRQMNVSEAIGADEIEPIQEAISYEARSAMALGAIAAFAATIVIGQTVARQSRREWADVATLRALGVANREVRWAAGLRGLAIGVPAALVAAVTAIVLSPVGPIGVGRRAEVDPGVAVDWIVLAIGTLGVLVLVTAAAALSLRRAHSRTPAATSSHRRLGLGLALPLTAIAGLLIRVRNRRFGQGVPITTAVAGVALAVATIVAAAGMTASLDALTGAPERFGATWDLSISNLSGNESSSEEIEPLLRGEPAIDSAAGIVGTDVQIGDELVWVQAFRSVADLPGIRPVITGGRAPAAVDEIALGSITMNDVGLSIGDRVEIRSTVTGIEPTTMTVVGTTIVNDTYETSPGRGGVVALEWIEATAPESSPDPYIVRLEPGADAQAFATTIEERLPVAATPPVPHGAIRNVERIAALPYLLAALIGVLAVASLAHTLTLSIRRSRHQLAVWQSIGFTRRQVRTAVAWYASTLAVEAALIGVPLGLVLGRLGWQTVADQIGVASQPAISLAGITLAVLGTVIVANLVALYPAWQAARLPTAAALRAE